MIFFTAIITVSVLSINLQDVSGMTEYTYEKGTVQHLSPCPGKYCGRTLLPNASWSPCGACQRGLRRNASSACVPCRDTPAPYDWLYLGACMLMPALLHLLCVHRAFRSYRGAGLRSAAWLMYPYAVLEVVVASVATLLATPPMGVPWVYSCAVRDIADWYPVLHNPNPNYEGALHCTQEAVYPLYSMVLVAYSTLLVLVVLGRPVLCRLLTASPEAQQHCQFALVYSALYFLPLLTALHALLAGLMYLAFPPLLLAASTASVAACLAHAPRQAPLALLRLPLASPSAACLLLGHWLLHAYAIVSLAELVGQPWLASLCALVPLPALFYALTAPFSGGEL